MFKDTLSLYLYISNLEGGVFHFFHNPISSRLENMVRLVNALLVECRASSIYINTCIHNSVQWEKSSADLMTVTRREKPTHC